MMWWKTKRFFMVLFGPYKNPRIYWSYPTGFGKRWWHRPPPWGEYAGWGSLWWNVGVGLFSNDGEKWDG